MPKKIPGSNASNNTNTAKSSKSVGRPNQSVAAIREEYAQMQQISRANFEIAMEGLKQFRDPNKASTITLNKYDRETIRGYLQNPSSNESNLRNVARYLYFRSQILYRIVHWYAGMWELGCRYIDFPSFDFSKGLDNNILKDYGETINQLELYNLESNMYAPLLRSYLEDVCYFLWFRDEEGSVPYILEPDECKIDGIYDKGGFSFSIDMSKWRSQQRQAIIEWIGDPLDAMWKEYQSSGVKWVHCPDEYAGCFKFNSEFMDIVMPPFTPLFQNLSALLDLDDIQAVADEQSIYKLLILPMKTINGSKVQNDFQIDTKLWLEYFDRMVQTALPDYISAAPMPGDGVDVVDFSTTSTDRDIDRVANAQKNIFGTSGGGAVLNANNITSTAAFEAWLQSESDFALSSLLGQVEGFCNRMLGYDVSNPCKVKFFEVTSLNKNKFRDSLLQAGQYGYAYRIALGTLFGVSERATLASLQFEQNVLGLQNQMIYPLQSSFTSSNENVANGNTDPVTGGAPEKDAGDLTPEGEKGRNK